TQVRLNGARSRCSFIWSAFSRKPESGAGSAFRTLFVIAHPTASPATTKPGNPIAASRRHLMHASSAHPLAVRSLPPGCFSHGAGRRVRLFVSNRPAAARGHPNWEVGSLRTRKPREVGSFDDGPGGSGTRGARYRVR